MLLGLVEVFVAAIAYGGASVLQGIAARRAAPTTGLDPRLLLQLAGTLPFIAGIAVDMVGFVASLLALRTLPLFLVQSAVASSVGVTALLAALLGARLRRQEVVSLGILGVGLVLLAASARPDNASPLPLLGRWALLIAVAPLAVLGAVAGRRTGRSAVTAIAVVAGLGFSIVAIAARTLTLPTPWWHAVTDPTVWALAASGVLAMLLYSMALQRGSVTTATAVSFAVDTLVPAVIGIALLGDRSRSGFAGIAIGGFVLTIGAAVALAKYGEAAVPSAHEVPA
ncbi:MAG: hypothetical protein ACR2KG_13025 [Nocardioidaceae bacterium]